MNEQTIQDVIESVRGRFYGKYRGTVTEVDPATMRIKAKVPSVYGETESGWALPCVPYAGDSVGFAFLPEVDSAVWIEFEAGNVSFPVWTGGFWLSQQAPSDAAPAVKVIVTKQLKLLFDDDQDSITLQDSNGNSVTLDSSGITLTRGSQTVQVSDSEVNINSGALEVM
ncbi:MAG TPA: phage baseplate assembly protein V [Candidatus Sulfotelmatobacter sp.]|nr:phage baseplate assembly protein V [Candidatus Sulfotelmatobacter sp.]